jgi:membrane-associated phospholipid phosphatase
VRASSAIRAAAVGAMAAGIAAPLVRRRLRLPAPLVTAVAASAPFGLCVAVPRSRARDVGTCVLQMWAYIATYEMPNDDPERLRARVRIDYPIAADTLIGLGTPPTLRLQRHSDPERFGFHEKVLVWSHWIWFLVPHASLAYVLVRRPDRFPRAAVLTYAVFDLGVLVYWAVPTAPPWYAADHGRMKPADERQELVKVRRMMVEYGEHFWQDGWQPLYSFLAGNPLAAMPSLHFATSVMAAHLLAETGPVGGVVGWTYAATLGVALVYLGEHYVIDLLVGLTLTEGISAAAPRVAPLFRGVSRAVAALEARAQG